MRVLWAVALCLEIVAALYVTGLAIYAKGQRDGGRDVLHSFLPNVSKDSSLESVNQEEK